MLIKFSELSLEERQILGNKDIHQYTVCNNSGMVLGRATDALLNELRNFRFLIVDLDSLNGSKRVLLPWEGKGIDTNSDRISVGSMTLEEAANMPNYNPLQSRREEIDAQIVQLLQERVLVDTKRRKIGEVIVRKEIETRIVEVPVRREILIVEQISPERKQLVSLDLGVVTDDRVKLVEGIDTNSTVTREFSSPEAAIEFLQNLGANFQSNLHKIRIDCTKL